MSRISHRTRVWERLSHESGIVRRLDIVASPVLAPGSIYFRKLTAFTGVHGAGKSYLLSALAEGLPRWQGRQNLPIESSDTDAELSGEYSLELKDGDSVRTIAFSRPIDWVERKGYDLELEPIVATWITPYVALSDLAYFTQEYSAKWSRVTGEVNQLKRAQVEVLGVITGHDYESVAYGQYGERDNYFPFIQAVRDSRVVDTFTMSASEYWVHFVMWNLQYASENEVVIIDEPETFLAQPGHSALVDEIGRRSLESGCQVVLATHSEAMIRSIPPELVRQVSSATGVAVVTQIKSAETLLRTLGRSPAPIAILVFVEDKMAQAIVRYLLGRHAPAHVSKVDVIDSGGKDEALRGASIVGRSGRLRAVAVLDGDQRARFGGGEILFIPGDSEPELQMVNSLRAHAFDAAEKIGVTVPELHVAIDAARFVPHQGTFPVMSGVLGCQVSELIGIALSLWLEDDSAAPRLVEQLLSPISLDH